jgi:hypothetical protein
MSSKLHRNNPIVVNFENCSKKLIQCRTEKKNFFKTAKELEPKYLA